MKECPFLADDLPVGSPRFRDRYSAEIVHGAFATLVYNGHF
jgi:hypothetical protein